MKHLAGVARDPEIALRKSTSNTRRTPSPRRHFARFANGRAGMDWLLHLRWLMRQMLRIGWLDRAAFERHQRQDLRLITRKPTTP